MITGKPGSGKTTFMKFLYEDLRIRNLLMNWSAGSEVHVLLHSFWGLSKEPAAHNWKGLLAHLITQLVPLESSAIANIIRKYLHKTTYDDWSVSELEEYLWSSLGIRSTTTAY